MSKKRRTERKKTVEKKQNNVETIPSRVDAPISKWGMHLIFAILLTFGILLTYSPSLKGVFTLDDVKIINRIDAMDHFPQLFGFRSIAYITFYLNKLIAELSAFNVRLTNIVIHLINSILVYVLVLMTITIKSERNQWDSLEDKFRYSTAWISSFIFALHPLNINAVAYIVQRMASLSALFVLLSLILYIRASTSHGKTKKRFFYLLSAVSLIIGIFSKENAIMGIPLILLYDYIFLSRFNRQTFLRKILPVAAISLLVLIIVSFSLRFHKTIFELGSIFLNLNQPLIHKPWMTTDVSWTPIQHILTEFRVISRYIFLTFVPLPGFMIFDGWGYPVSKGLSTPPTTFLAIIFITGTLIFSIIKRRNYPFFFFGVSWYLIAISLESFLAVGADLYFEHRNYLPLSGLLAGLVIQSVVSLRPILLRRTQPFLIMVSIFILLLSIFTFQRNLIWKDFLSLWIETIEKAPYNTRAIVTVGKNYFLSSKYNEAEYYFKTSLEYALEKKQSYFYQESALFLGNIYLIKGRFEEAEELIKVFHRKVPGSYKLMILKGLYLSTQNTLKKAVAFYNQAFEEIKKKNKKLDLLLHIGFADIYRKTGMLKEAESAYKYILNEHPSNSLSHYGLAMLYMDEGKFKQAKESLDRSLNLFPTDIRALSAKARLALIMDKRVDEAVSHTKNALSLSQSFYEPYLDMAIILILQGKDKEADKFLERAKVLYRSAPNHEINYAKAIGYSLKGDDHSAKIHLKKILDDINAPDGIKKAIRNNGLFTD